MRRLLLALALAFSIAPAFAQAPPPVPALPDTERRTAATLSASTGPVNVGFALYGDGTDYGAWLEVWVNGVQKTAVSDWVLTSPSGTLATLARPITNAQVTFNAAQTGTVQIVGARRPRRTSQFQENRGVAARDLNQVVTDLVATERETWDKINDVSGRVLITPPGETLSMLPPASTRANLLLGFDGAGNATVTTGSGGGGGGGILGPVTTIVSDVVCWNNTAGTLLKSCGTLTITGTPETIAPGPTSPTIGTAMQQDWAWGSSADRTACQAEAGIWASRTYTGWCFAKTFDSTYTGTGGSIASTMFVFAKNTGAVNAVLPVVADVLASANSTTNFAGNFICRTALAVTGVACNGLEIDIEPAAGVTLASSIGLPINMFTSANPGPAIQTGGVSGGTWGNGIVIGGLASTGAGIVANAGATMNALVNASVGVYGTTAIILGTGASQGISFGPSGFGTNPLQYGDVSGNLIFDLGTTNAYLINDKAGALMGSVTASGISTTKALLNTSAVPVITACGTSPTVATGSTNQGGQFTTGTATPSSCTVTFANAYPNFAFCVIHPANAAAVAVTAYIAASTKAAFAVTLSAGTSSAAFNYACNGN